MDTIFYHDEHILKATEQLIKEAEIKGITSISEICDKEPIATDNFGELDPFVVVMRKEKFPGPLYWDDMKHLTDQVNSFVYGFDTKRLEGNNYHLWLARLAIQSGLTSFATKIADSWSTFSELKADMPGFIALKSTAKQGYSIRSIARALIKTSLNQETVIFGGVASDDYESYLEKLEARAGGDGLLVVTAVNRQFAIKELVEKVAASGHKTAVIYKTGMGGSDLDIPADRKLTLEGCDYGYELFGF